MNDHASGLLLTRPLDQSRRFLSDCEALLGRKIDAMISPVFKIVPSKGMPDLDAAKTIVVTSSNAVRVLGAELEGRAVATVGAATAELARSFGARATTLGDTADEFLENTDKLQAPVLVCRGVHARVDLAVLLKARGIEATAVPVYDQVEQPLNSAAAQLLRRDRTLIAPVFSPRSAILLSRAPRTAKMVVPAISQAAADAWIGPADLRVANAPTSDAMATLVTEAL